MQYVQVTLTDGRKISHFTKFPPGTKENPLDTEAVKANARDLSDRARHVNGGGSAHARRASH
jgi:hypothetical protein